MSQYNGAFLLLKRIIYNKIKIKRSNILNSLCCISILMSKSRNYCAGEKLFNSQLAENMLNVVNFDCFTVKEREFPLFFYHLFLICSGFVKK